MTATRLSPLDASFLAVETPTAHMHVGWAAIFEPPADGARPSFEQLREHIVAPAAAGAAVPADAAAGAVRDQRPGLGRRPRLRRLPARGRPRSRTSSARWSRSACRSRCRGPPAVAGLDRRPARRRADRRGRQGPPLHGRRDRRRRARQPAARSRPRRSAARAGRMVAGVRPQRSEAARAWARRPGAQPARPGGDSRPRGPRSPRPGPGARLAGSAGRGRASRCGASGPPTAQLNSPISPLRHLGLLARPIDDLARIKGAFGVKLNDVVLAASAGGVRGVPAGSAARTRSASRRWCRSTSAGPARPISSATGSRSCSLTFPATSPTRCAGCARSTPRPATASAPGSDAVVPGCGVAPAARTRARSTGT